MEDSAMKRAFTHLAIAAALAAAPLGAQALGTNEKGCLVGGAAGGVVGHNVGSGNNTLLGAAIGCGAGVLINKKRVEKIDAKAREKKYAERKHRERVVQRDNNKDLTPLR
jgi:outer membrane lipoprotein SlyB